MKRKKMEYEKGEITGIPKRKGRGGEIPRVSERTLWILLMMRHISSTESHTENGTNSFK
jgi:hypothetical protein